MLGVVLQHDGHEIHVILRKEAFGLELSVCLPKSGASIVTDKSVKIVFALSPFHEGWAATNHDEEDYGGRKEIDILTAVMLLRNNLRRHVTRSANVTRIKPFSVTSV